MHPRRTESFLVCLLVWLCAVQLLAQTNGEPQILSLHLKIQNQTLSVIETNTRPGALKPPRDAEAAGLYYEVISSAGAALWKSTMEDPTVLHLEYEEPPHSGKLKRKTVVL